MIEEDSMDDEPEIAYIYEDPGAGLCITTDEDWMEHAMETYDFDFFKVDINDLPKVTMGKRFAEVNDE